MKSFLSIVRRYRFWIFACAIVVAIGLRLWDFSDGMLLKGDQIRDAIMAERAFEGGILELPLLGPRAGGTKLRLGPMFYYFQTAAAAVFQSVEPWVLALPNLIFSLLAIGAFYLLVRMYFSKNVSLLTTVLFAFSFLGFEYSRFSWNPNSIPFFVIMFLYAWLKIFTATEKKSSWWFVLLGAMFAIASQLHFTSFIALPIFMAIFLAATWKRCWKHVGWKNLMVFLVTVVIIYLPVIVSDVINNGDNLLLFFKSIGTKKSDHGLIENIVKDLDMFGIYYFRMAFAYMGKLKVLHYLGTALFVLGTIYAAIAWKKEANQRRKDFLFVFVAWTLTVFLLYIPLAYDIDKPRFFLPLLFIPFVHVGFLLERKLAWKITGMTIAVMMLLVNAIASVLWLSEFAKAQTQEFNAKQSIILKAKKDAAWWSWGMIEQASEQMSLACQGEAIYYILPSQSVEFTDVFDWAFHLNGEKRSYALAKKIRNDKKGCIFVVSKQSYPIENMNTGKNGLTDVASVGDIAIRKVVRSAEEEGTVANGASAEKIVQREEELNCTFEQAAHQRAYIKDVIRFFKCKK